MNPIKKYRLKAEITQKQLADRLGIDRSTVAAWELGINAPKISNLIRLSKVFKCKLDSLVREKM